MGYKSKLFALAAACLLIAASLVFLAAFDAQRDQAADGQVLGDVKDPSWFTDNGYIEIATDADLSKIGTDPAFPLYGKYYLADDITLPAQPVNEQNHTSIGSSVAPFTGIFDGNGHTIFGIETFGIGNSSERAAGLFAYVGDGAEILELSVRNRVHDWNSSTYKYFGGIIGCVVTDANVKLTNCSSDAWVMTWYSSHPYSGGLIGASFGNVTITGCYNKTTSAVIEATWEGAAGGLIGLNAGTVLIKDSYNVGKVRSVSTAGGLIGMCTGSATITNSYNTGYLENAQGVVSNEDLQNGELINTERVLTSTTFPSYAGGIIAHVTGSGSVLIKECYSSGRVIQALKLGIYAGGIVGSVEGTVDMKITDCYNVGNFTLYSGAETVCTAGILAYSEPSVTIANCYTAGYIKIQTPSGSEKVIAGNIVASCPAAKIYRCYFLEDQVRANGTVVDTFAPSSAKVDGNADSTPGDGHQGSGSKTQAEMAYDLADIRKGLSIYHIDATGAVAGWDFEHIWTIIDGVNKGFPVFGVSPVIGEGPIGGGEGGTTPVTGDGSGGDLWLLAVAAAALLGLFLLGFLLRRKNCIEVEIIDEQTRTGSQITPTPWVRYRGRLLKLGEDMLYEYADNIEAGFGVVIIKLIGNYSGIVTVTFPIVEE